MQLNPILRKRMPRPLMGGQADDSIMQNGHEEGLALDESYLPLVFKYEYYQQKEIEMAEYKETAANRLKELLGDHETATVGAHTINWRTVVSERLDIQRLQEERPETYRKYLGQSSYRRFTVN